MEMVLKKIEHVYHAGPTHMVGDGFKVTNYFPSGHVVDLSPFILLDYNTPWELSGTSGNHQRGVGGHPHRGFETVTFVYDGALEHRDSSGNSGKIYAGDVQWMTAGSGVLHEEFHEKEFSKKGGTFHAIQLWVNLPAKEKMTKPSYQTLLNAQIPKKKVDSEGSYVRVVAGNYEGIQGIAHTFSPIEVYDAKLKKGAAAYFNFPDTYNTAILVTAGSLEINQKAVRFKDLIAFGHEGDKIECRAQEECSFLVLSGKPLNEPVVFQGPFVMTSQAEINQAFSDFRVGKFGQL